ncbi:MAG: ferritin-like domain-containing protein [Sphingobacteriaceae bacterium]
MKNVTSKSNSAGDMELKDSALFELFVSELRDLYWAEKHIVKNLPKMAKAATSGDLKNAFQEHLSETETQVERLEEIFQLIDKRAVGKRCEAMDGLVEEGKTKIEDTEQGSLTRDVGLIASAQKIEHYEIAAYGTLKTIASVLQLDDQIADLLNETLEEEKNADVKLTEIAQSHLNEDAREERK